MRRFRLAGQVIDEMDPGLQSILANAYDLRIRPLCLCREPGLAMYIARVGTQYVVKRMPLSGSGHDPQCPSYEAPDELSGLGVLMGSAIQVCLCSRGRDTATRIGKTMAATRMAKNRFTRLGKQTIIVELPKVSSPFFPRGGHRVGRLSGLFTLCGLLKFLPN